MQHECDTSSRSATQVLHKLHESYTYDTSGTRGKNFDFDNDTSKNIFLHPFMYLMASERLHGEKQFHSRNYVLEIPC